MLCVFPLFWFRVDLRLLPHRSCLVGSYRSMIRRLIRVINGTVTGCLPGLTFLSVYQLPFALSKFPQLWVFPWLFHDKPFYSHLWPSPLWGYLCVLLRPSAFIFPNISPQPFLLSLCHQLYLLFLFLTSFSSFVNFLNKRGSWFVKSGTEIHVEIRAEKVHKNTFTYS